MQRAAAERDGGLGGARSLVLALLVATAGALVAGAGWWSVSTVRPLPAPPAAAVAAVTDRGSGAVVAVVGDAWSMGGPPETAWPAQVCRRLGCVVTSSVAPGVGWSVPGVDGQDVGDRLPAVVAADPDVVVLAAGAHDTATWAPRVRGSLNQALWRLEQQLPGTPVVVLSPFAPLAPAPAEVVAVRGMVWEAAVKHDAAFVEVTDLFDAAHPGGVEASGLPTPYGQAMVADLVTPVVAEALAR